MQALFGLVILILIAVPVLVIWLAFSHHALRREVENLGGEINRLKSLGTVTATPATPSSPWQAAKTAQSPTETKTTTPAQKPNGTRADAPPPLPAAAATTTAAEATPKSFVFDTATIGRFTKWISENWFIAVAAVSLAMAGIFLVQYGIENGILSPRNRVLSALAFGAGLIGFGEWIRRRASDDEGTAAFLPSTFAGAGIVTLFSAILAAQQLYGLIGKETAFIGLVGLAGLSVVLGWLYGPFLTVIGLTGAVAAPFIVSDGTSENITWLFYYFALISAIGLSVES